MAKTIDWGTAELLTPEDDARNIIATSQGLPGSGKSHFWLTAKGPIAWHLFDPGGLKGLRSNELFVDKEVRVFDYCGTSNIAKLEKQDRMLRSIEVFEQFKANWDISVRNAQTIVVDKETLLWEIIRYAHDEVDSPQPKNFHELNLFYRGWVHDAEVHKLNLGFIRDVSEIWGKTGVSRTTGNIQMGYTGKFRSDGQKKVPGLVQVQLEHRWDEDAREFRVKILEKCRLGEAAKLMGKEFPDLKFPDLGLMLFPNSEEGDWE